MARPRIKRARVGNYGQDVDPTDIDASMAGTMFGTPLNKMESSYLKGTNRPSSMEAIRRARKANKQPPIRE